MTTRAMWSLPRAKPTIDERRQHVERQRHEDGAGDRLRAGWAPRPSSGRPRRGRTVGARRCAPVREMRHASSATNATTHASPSETEEPPREVRHGQGEPEGEDQQHQDRRVVEARRPRSPASVERRRADRPGSSATGQSRPRPVRRARGPRSRPERARSSTTVPAVRSAKPRRSGEASADTAAQHPTKTATSEKTMPTPRRLPSSSPVLPAMTSGSHATASVMNPESIARRSAARGSTVALVEPADADAGDLLAGGGADRGHEHRLVGDDRPRSRRSAGRAPGRPTRRAPG